MGKKTYTSRQRKIHKLKRLNVKLGQQRSALITECINTKTTMVLPIDKELQVSKCADLFERYWLSGISEMIGKNGNKVQRLRTLESQEKKNVWVNEWLDNTL